jgi:hypothetical protein
VSLRATGTSFHGAAAAVRFQLVRKLGYECAGAVHHGDYRGGRHAVNLGLVSHTGGHAENSPRAAECVAHDHGFVPIVRDVLASRGQPCQGAFALVGAVLSEDVNIERSRE